MRRGPVGIFRDLVDLTVFLGLIGQFIFGTATLRYCFDSDPFGTGAFLQMLFSSLPQQQSSFFFVGAV